MEYWVMWLIIVGIGVVVGFIIHAAMRFAQGGNVFTPILAGVIGALIGAFYFAPNIPITTSSLMVERFTWAVVGAAVLSAVFELLFVGSRRGRVVTS